jgi:hypothetical protein
MENKEFGPYEESLSLKELGFDEPCFGEYRQWDGSKPYLQLYQDLDGCSTDPADYEYTTECIAPTFSQTFRWFREKYELEGDISHLNDGRFKWSYQIRNITNNPELSKILESQPYFESYEEAELACLRKLIQIVKK